MPIQHLKRRPAFPPIGRLRSSPISGGGKKALMTSLNLTAMVDMFTVIVIFLLQMFSANGDLQFMVKGLKTPTAKETQLLEERGPVITLFQNQVLFEGEPGKTYEVWRIPAVAGAGVNWTKVGEATATVSGVATFVDPAPLANSAYYRARTK